MKILPKTILPKAFGTRPRLAVEIRWGGVVAARAEAESAAATGLVAAVSRAELGAEAIGAIDRSVAPVAVGLAIGALPR